MILRILILSFAIFSSLLQAQRLTTGTYKRTSDLLRNYGVSYPFGLSKFIQNLNLNSYDDWRSASSVISLNGIQFNTIPLNYTSPDFVPIDLLQVDSIHFYSEPDIRGNNIYPSGGIEIFSKEIRDTFQIQFRSFTGSETGDPLIYRFTRQNISIVNKNKIVPSAVISVEGKSLVNYRFTAGYFGYFAFNSSENSEILSSLAHHLTKKQNRQILGSAELTYKLAGQKEISLYSSLIHFFGWELPPFITSFVHLRSYNFANRLQFSNLFKGFLAGVKYDGNISSLEPMELTPAGKFLLNDVSLFTSYTYSAENGILLEIHSEAGNYSGINSDPDTEFKQNIFDRQRSYLYYHIAPRLNIPLLEGFRFIPSVRLEKNILPVHVLSASLKLWFDLFQKHHLALTASSTASFPGIHEKFGRFSTFRKKHENSVLDTFTIAGNENLLHERVNNLSAYYKYANPVFQVSFNPFLRNVNNNIKMYDLNVISSYYPGDVIRNSEFRNEGDKSSWGINSSISYAFPFFTLSSAYAGIFTKHINPKNVLIIASKVSGNIWGSFLIEYLYSSARTYKEFDFEDNPGIFSSGIPEINLFSITYSNTLPRLYSLNTILLGIKVDNVFNRKVKFHPMGNNADRAIEFYLSFQI